MTINISVLMCAFRESVDQFNLAVQSVILQTRRPSQIIVIDDSGDSRYKTICEAIKKQINDSALNIELKYFSNEVNLGLVKSLNFGLTKISGDYIARMDADDISLPLRFYDQCSMLDMGYDIVGASIQHFDGEKTIRSVAYPKSQIGIIKSFIFNNPIAHPAVMLKKSVMDQLNGYRAIEYAEDLDLWMRAYFAGYRIGNSGSTLLLRRIHKDQISTRNSNIQNLNAKSLRRNFFKLILKDRFNLSIL